MPRYIIALTLLACIMGCGGYVQNPKASTTLLPNLEGPQEARIAPSVVLIGDSVMGTWITSAVLAANPSWVNQTSAQGIQETTQDILARFPAAIALHPQIIVIEAGTWSMQPLNPEPSWMCNYGGDEPIDPTADNPCDDISTMVTDAEAAGIYAIVCTIPPWDVGSLATQIDATDPEPNDRRYNDGSFNFSLLALEHPANFVPLGFVDIYGLLNDIGATWWEGVSEDDVEYFYNPTYTDDGVTPNTAGQQLIVAAVKAEIEASKAHGFAR